MPFILRKNILMAQSVCLIVRFEQTAINTKPTTLDKTTINPFVNPLHFGTAFWVCAFWMLDIWHERYIQLSI